MIKLFKIHAEAEEWPGGCDCCKHPTDYIKTPKLLIFLNRGMVQSAIVCCTCAAHALPHLGQTFDDFASFKEIIQQQEKRISSWERSEYYGPDR